MSVGFSIGGEGAPNTEHSLSGLILFEEFESLSSEQLEAVVNGNLFSFTLSESNEHVGGFFHDWETGSALAWGWSAANSGSTLLLTELYDYGDTTLLGGPSALDSQGSSSFSYGFEYLASNSVAGSYQTGVGGFDLIDELDQFNQVDGIYTIEKKLLGKNAFAPKKGRLDKRPFHFVILFRAFDLFFLEIQRR
jgi:hypothetical protein